jgi:RNA-directed DNA polymerase
VVETDIANCFDAIPHSGLVSAVEERICDRNVLKLIRALLRVGVMEDGAVRRSITGTPQGGVVSPLLANAYLHRLDRQWERRGTGVLCRYADDLVVLCKTRREAEAALAALTAILAELELAFREDKTRIIKLQEGGEGFDFLGFHHRLVRSRLRGNRSVLFLARWPSRKAMEQARRRIRDITVRRRLLLPVDQVVQQAGRYLHGWAGYFRYGNSAPWLDKMSSYALLRTALFVAKRHGKRRGYGWAVVY